MRPEVTNKQHGWTVDTREGIWFVPGEVFTVPECFAIGVELPSWLAETVLEELRDYVGAASVDGAKVEVCEGYFVRLSASGYLDCTEWTLCRTKREVREEIRNLRGEE